MTDNPAGWNQNGTSGWGGAPVPAQGSYPGQVPGQAPGQVPAGYPDPAQQGYGDPAQYPAQGAPQLPTQPYPQQPMPQAAGQAQMPQPSAPAASHIPSLSFSDGRTFELTGSVLIGRNPSPGEGEAFDQLILISDPSLSVSKTHVVAALNDGQVWVADRFSTNGTSITMPDGSTQACPPGQWVMAASGSVVHFGVHWFAVN